MTQTKWNHEEAVAKDKQYIWHQITPYDEKKEPMVVNYAQGAWIGDTAGNKYLDGMSGLWCVNVGYGRKELAEAAYEQLQEMPYYPLTQSHLPAIQLAEKLNTWLESDYKFFFTNSGSEANETAFKVARQYHEQNGEKGRYKFISRYRAYHGSTLGALAATGQPQRKYGYEPLTPGFVHATPPDSYRVPSGQTEEEWALSCAREIENMILWEKPDTVAGVIMEPIITGGGVLIPHPSYLKTVQEICHKYGVLFMIDEVICGFGRTGKKFTFQHYGVQPDIVSMAKGITSGYLPLAATAIKKEIFERFKGNDENSHFRHVSTFGGNPAACRLALKNIEIMERENLVQRSEDIGSRLYEKLQPLKDHPHVGDLRHKGLLFGIELVADKKSKQPADSAIVGEKMAACKQKGLIIGRNGDTVSGSNNILALAPPLSLTDDDVDFIAETLLEVFS